MDRGTLAGGGNTQSNWWTTTKGDQNPPLTTQWGRPVPRGRLPPQRGNKRRAVSQSKRGRPVPRGCLQPLRGDRVRAVSQGAGALLRVQAPSTMMTTVGWGCRLGGLGRCLFGFSETVLKGEVEEAGPKLNQRPGTCIAARGRGVDFVVCTQGPCVSLLSPCQPGGPRKCS